MSPEEGGDLVQGTVEDGSEAVPHPRIGVQLGPRKPVDRAPQQGEVREWIRLSRQEQYRAADSRPVRGALLPRLAAPGRMERVREQDEGGHLLFGGQEGGNAPPERMPTDDGGCRVLVVERGTVDPDGALRASLRKLDEADVEAARREAALVVAQPLDRPGRPGRQENSRDGHRPRIGRY